MTNGKTNGTPDQDKKKVLIGILASQDGFEQHQSLQNIFKYLEKYGYGKDDQGNLKKDMYHFLITGGTYDRLLYGYDFKNNVFLIDPQNPAAKKSDFSGASTTQNKDSKILEGFYEDGKKSRFELNSTKLPPATEGGVIILSYLITQRQCCIVWPFFSHESQHWQRLENLAFMRLCDKCHVKRLLNGRSVRTWLNFEADNYDSKLKPEVNTKQISFPHFKYKDLSDGDGLKEFLKGFNPDIDNKGKTLSESIKELIQLNLPLANDQFQEYKKLFQDRDGKKNLEDMTIALIAHNEMKPRMIDFAVDYETELKKFKKILATGTTGREVAAATSKELDNKLFRCHSGPEGGDIEIATAILYGLCDIVIFFIDPLQAHPHIEDIRVVLQACMMNENVIIITNEMHAREFMARVVRNHNEINLDVEVD